MLNVENLFVLDQDLGKVKEVKLLEEGGIVNIYNMWELTKKYFKDVWTHLWGGYLSG